MILPVTARAGLLWPEALHPSPLLPDFLSLSLSLSLLYNNNNNNNNPHVHLNLLLDGLYQLGNHLEHHLTLDASVSMSTDSARPPLALSKSSSQSLHRRLDAI